MHNRAVRQVLVAVALTLPGTPLPGPAYAAEPATDVPPGSETFEPGTVTFSPPTVRGAGCSRVTAAMNSKNTSFNILFNGQFTVASNRADPDSSTQLDCRLSLTVSGPAGYAFAISDAASYGFADLSPDVRGTISMNVFQGDTRADGTTNTIDGSFAGNWNFNAVSAVIKPVWSECSTESSLTIDTSLTLTGSTPEDTRSLMTIENQEIIIIWKKC